MMQLPKQKFYMIRHGESEANVRQVFSGQIDVPLTDIGRQQAEAARLIVENLAVKPVLIVHSHLQRARHTAEIINSRLQLPMVETPLLSEHDFGDWENTPWDSKHHEFHNGINPPNGETHIQFMNRVCEAIQFSLNQPKAKEGLVLMACHGGLFRAIKQIYKQPYERAPNAILHEYSPIPERTEFPWDITIHQ